MKRRLLFSAIMLVLLSSVSVDARQDERKQPGGDWLKYGFPETLFFGQLAIYYTDHDEGGMTIAPNSCNSNLFVRQGGIFEMTYNSLETVRKGRFGYGWSAFPDMSYDITTGKSGSLYRFTLEEGATISFVKKDGEYTVADMYSSGCKLIEDDRDKYRVVTARGTYLFGDPSTKFLTRYERPRDESGFEFVAENGKTTKVRFFKGKETTRELAVAMEEGRITQFVDGKKIFKYAYDKEGHLVGYAAEGTEKPLSVVFRYNKRHQLTAVERNVGASFTFGYDTASMTSVRTGDKQHRYEWDFQKKNTAVLRILNHDDPKQATRWVRFTYRKGDMANKSVAPTWYLALLEDSEGIKIDYEALARERQK